MKIEIRAKSSFIRATNYSRSSTFQNLLISGKRKVHFLMEDGKEMVEEYSNDTNVVVRRAWRQKGKLGQDIGWEVEIGDPEPTRAENLDNIGIRESSSAVGQILVNEILLLQYFNCETFDFQPIITRRVTKTALEWRIRNLSYPKDVYSVTAEDDGTITVRTSNKKYFKKITVPDLERSGLKPEQDRISFTHQYNTLIITVSISNLFFPIDLLAFMEKFP